MSWRGEEGGIAAANQDHDVIMTPVDWCYLDYYQADPATEPLAIGNFLPVEKVYGYEPVPASLPSEKAKHILGAQCNVWTEYIKTPEHCEYMVYPRAIAMSEVLWSPASARNYPGFVERIKQHRSQMDAWKINYATHIFESDSIK
jgi:hexosaminidase